MTEAEEILLVTGGQPTIPLVPTLPADGKPPVVWFNGGVWVYENGEWTIGSLDVGEYTMLVDENRIIGVDENFNIAVEV